MSTDNTMYDVHFRTGDISKIVYRFMECPYLSMKHFNATGFGPNPSSISLIAGEDPAKLFDEISEVSIEKILERNNNMFMAIGTLDQTTDLRIGFMGYRPSTPNTLTLITYGKIGENDVKKIIDYLESY